MKLGRARAVNKEKYDLIGARRRARILAWVAAEWRSALLVNSVTFLLPYARTWSTYSGNMLVYVTIYIQ